jgi:hypothetical protein
MQDDGIQEEEFVPSIQPGLPSPSSLDANGMGLFWTDEWGQTNGKSKSKLDSFVPIRLIKPQFQQI